MNLPNKLTIARVILVPFFMIFIILPDISPLSQLTCDLIAAVLFGIASLTDMLDGKIARKYNLITDFGKFMDPIADKLMTFGAFFMFMVSEVYAHYRFAFAFVVFVVLVREFAVTSLRLVAQTSGGKVIAAGMSGKIKTVSQIIFILIALLEKHVFFFSDFCAHYMPLSVLACAVMLFFTVLSGIEYFKDNLSFLDPSK